VAGAVWLGDERGLDERSFKFIDASGAEAFDPFGDNLGRGVELARGSSAARSLVPIGTPGVGARYRQANERY